MLEERSARDGGGDANRWDLGSSLALWEDRVDEILYSIHDFVYNVSKGSSLTGLLPSPFLLVDFVFHLIDSDTYMVL